MNIPKSLKDLVLDAGEFEKEHYKNSDFDAWWTLKITQDVLDIYAVGPTENTEWLPFLNLTIVATGAWSYYGGAVINDWSVYREQVEQSEHSRDFWDLMSHLNSEDIKRAQEFAAKYIKDKVELVRVEPDLPSNSMPTVGKDVAAWEYLKSLGGCV